MEEKEKIVYVQIDDILPNRFQPRLAFDEKELNNLAASISRYGIIQPIVLRRIGDKYEIIAGERRFKASQLAGLTEVPAIINDTDDNTSAEIALLENLQRSNLTVIEEAQSYKKLIDRGFTQEEIATKLGVSQSSVANKIRLLNLPKSIQNALLYNKISERHARCLLSLNDTNLQEELLEKIISLRLTVKQTEDEVSSILKKEETSNNIPEEIQKYINRDEINSVINNNINNQELPKPEEEKTITNEQKDSIVDIPEVVNIDDKTLESIREIIPEYQKITPFGEVEEDNKNTYTQILNNERKTFIDNIPEEPKVNNEQPNRVEIPKMITKVRNLIREMDEESNKIRTIENDLGDKYQIIIEIKKNTEELK